ncbi:MAG: DUF429 domain-containing protein [Xanthomonadales bacterium]|nr:DUF429 domain-containing protein [Xanthomonadales bacterium]
MHPTHEGHGCCVALLGEHVALAAVQDVVASRPGRLAARVDLADALAALWSAERIAAGRAGSLPSLPAVDSAGLQTAIWY